MSDNKSKSNSSKPQQGNQGSRPATENNATRANKTFSQEQKGISNDIRIAKPKGK